MCSTIREKKISRQMLLEDRLCVVQPMFHMIKNSCLRRLIIDHLGVNLLDAYNGALIKWNGSESSLVLQVNKKQHDDTILSQLIDVVPQQNLGVLFQEGDSILCYQGRLCVQNINGIRHPILGKAYNSKYFIHLRATKMYHDIQEVY